MASSDTTNRAVLAGLSCGIGMAAPVVLYTATLPFSRVNETIAAGAIPFAAGAVAGVGLMCASLSISDRRAREEEDEGFSFDGKVENEFSTAEFTVPQAGRAQRTFGADSAAAGSAAGATDAAESSQQAQPASRPSSAASASSTTPSSTASFLSGLTGALQRRRSLDDVPKIERAYGAPSEEEAWAMIDSMLDEDSPVSCDPARSRDIYQVAIDEMRDGGFQTGAVNREDIEAAARAAAGSRTAPAGTTATFVALVADAAAQSAASAPEASAAPIEVEPLSVDIVEEEEVKAARQAAVDSLWGAPAAAQGPGVRSVPFNDALASLPVLSAEDEAADAKVETHVAFEPAGPVADAAQTQGSVSADTVAVSTVDAATERMEAVSSQTTAHLDAEPRVDTGDLPDASLEDDIPMRDYSGHENMWAAALSILDEEDDSATALREAVGAPAASETVGEEPTYVGRHSRVLPEDTARISRKNLERVGAIAEGVLADRRHQHVNRILEEEIDRIGSRSVRRTGHEYLSVIEGGTASFTPLKAEA